MSSLPDSDLTTRYIFIVLQFKLTRKAGFNFLCNARFQILLSRYAPLSDNREAIMDREKGQGRSVALGAMG